LSRCTVGLRLEDGKTLETSTFHTKKAGNDGHNTAQAAIISSVPYANGWK